jgi:hypothetical protein
MRRWLLLGILCAAVPSLTRADEACRRNPEPVCVIDWAAAGAARENAQGYARARLLVRLRTGRLEEAQALAPQIAAKLEDNLLLLELQARTGGPDAARAGLDRLRSRYEQFLDKPSSSVDLVLPDYLPIADAQRRGGVTGDAQDTARRAAGFVQAWQARRAADPAIALEAAKLLAEIGAVQLRAGDRGGASASLALAERLAPLADDPAKARDSLADGFATFRGRARLSRAIGQAEPLRARLALLAARAREDAGGATGTRLRGLHWLIAKVAALQAYAGDRAAAQTSTEAAKDLSRILIDDGAPAPDLTQLLFDAHLALGDWASARAVIAVEGQERVRAYLLELLVEAQVEQGQLKDAVETALTAAPEKQAHLLRQAALAATAER